MPTYLTPGVYIEEIPKFPPSVAPVATAIPAFVGYTKKDDLKLKATRIESLVEFEQLFGGPDLEAKITVSITETKTPPSSVVTADLLAADRSKHLLYYALQLFYANGGKTAYVVSVGKYNAAPSLADLQAGLDPVRTADEPTLIVIPEATALPIADFKALTDAALQQCANLGDRFVIIDAHGDDKPLGEASTKIKDAIGKFRNAGVGTGNLKYGAAYAPHLATVLDYQYDESKVALSHKVDGANGTLDAKKLDAAKAANSALYERAKAAITAIPLVLPPSGAIAGIYAQVDATRGVWKAPANVSINAVIKPTIEFANTEQDDMNVDPTAGKSVNAIRAFVGKGTLVWGARTLAGNDNEWRYVNVRRFFIFAEESIKKATEPFTFEPNDANTWVKVQAMIENFLTVQWRAGALQGIKPEHAFYVAVGLGKTMTALDILEGRMIVEIGLAVVRPAEFIILRFSHKMAES
jgi:phage tail sheath protein FI